MNVAVNDNAIDYGALRKKHPDISETSVKEAIRMNPSPVSVSCLTTLFNAKRPVQPQYKFSPIFHPRLTMKYGAALTKAKERRALLAHCLETISNDNDISFTKNRGYKSKSPYADLAIATITNIHPDGSASATIDGIDPEITHFSKSQTRRHHLNKDEQYLVRIDRNKMTGQLNLFPLEKIKDPRQNIYIAGKKTKDDTTHAHALDNSIKTQFNILGEKLKGRQNPYPVLEIKASEFSITNPTARLAKSQDHDITSGLRISQILGEKFGLNRGHPPRSNEQARAITNKSIPHHKRKDYINKNFFTVDPDGATDLDDAICVERLPNDRGYKAYIAISDVPAFIHPNTPLDNSAQKKATSFYFNDGNTYHMLPDILATETLSLLEDKERATIVVEIEFDNEGTKTNEQINLARIKSKKQMSYSDFEKSKNNRSPLTSHAVDLFTLLSQRKNEIRNKHISSKNLLADPTLLTPSNFIPTFMVMANGIISKKIHDDYGYGCFRNCGPLGEQENYCKIRKILKNLGYELPQQAIDCSWETLDDIINKANTKENGEFETVLDLLRKYLFERAYYSTDPLGHFPIGLQIYGHVTSPERRYADWINLRMLHKTIDPNDPAGKAYTKEEIENITKHLNRERLREANIKNFEQRFHIINTMFIHQNSGANAMITDIDHNYIEIMHTASKLTTTLIIDDTQIDEIYKLDENELSLVATDPTDGEQKTYRLGDTIPIRITNVDPAQAKWDCTLHTPHQFISKQTKPEKEKDTIKNNSGLLKRILRLG